MRSRFWVGQAAEFAHRAVELAPSSSRGYHAQGMAHWFLQDVEPSLEALQTALKLNPNATEVAADLGLHWSLLGDWDRGISLIQQALEQAPFQADSGHVAVSLYHFVNSRFEKALAEARRISITARHLRACVQGHRSCPAWTPRRTAPTPFEAKRRTSRGSARATAPTGHPTGTYERAPSATGRALAQAPM